LSLFITQAFLCRIYLEKIISLFTVYYDIQKTLKHPESPVAIAFSLLYFIFGLLLVRIPQSRNSTYRTWSQM